ncbi:MAG TPA: hypothetical protein VFW92_06450 [Candidatus Limnocylindrales bacterium]|nr:hypothetical protein [Candidatus Limnocylindrales bacterium]
MPAGSHLQAAKPEVTAATSDGLSELGGGLVGAVLAAAALLVVVLVLGRPL